MLLRHLHKGLMDWQGLIGNLVGFFGVCCTLWFNARKSLDLERFKSELKNKADEKTLDGERLALRTVLFVEVSYQISQVCIAIDSLGHPMIGESGEISCIARAKFSSSLYKDLRREAAILTLNEQAALAALLVFEPILVERLKMFSVPWTNAHGEMTDIMYISSIDGINVYKTNLNFLFSYCSNLFKSLDENMPADSKVTPLF